MLMEQLTTMTRVGMIATQRMNIWKSMIAGIAAMTIIPTTRIHLFYTTTRVIVGYVQQVSSG